jgi:hypothetical protein
VDGVAKGDGDGGHEEIFYFKVSLLLTSELALATFKNIF